MSDKASQTKQLDDDQKMSRAQDTFIYEAIKYMESGYPMERGQGTVSLNKAGELSIKGLNEDKSRIDWDVKVTGSMKGSWPNFEIVTNSTVDQAGTVVHKENANYKTGVSKEEYYFANGKNDKSNVMTGSCQTFDDSSKVCDFKLDGGTAHVEQGPSKDDVTKSKISMKTADGEQSIDFTYTTSGKIGTYSYEKSK